MKLRKSNTRFALPGSSYASLAVALATSLTTASAQTWQGATTGNGNAIQADKTIADYNWANTANWAGGVAPNAAGTTATFNTLTGALSVYADTTAATTITYGAINLNSNQSLNFGLGNNSDPTVDLGNFVIDGTGLAGGNAVINYNTGIGINNSRGVTFSGKKADQTTLSSNLIVNMNSGSNTYQVLNFNSVAPALTATQAGFNGGGNTITINGGVVNIGQSGFNSNSIRNTVLDLRNGLQTANQGDFGTTSGGVLQVVSGGSANPATDVTIRIGTAGGQSITSAGADSFRYELFDKVNVGSVQGAIVANNSKPFNGIIAAGNAAGNLHFVSRDARQLNTIAGVSANTYAGGTTVALNWTAASGAASATVGQSRLLLNKDNALGTGALTFGNNTSLVSLNVANNTIGGLRNGGVGSDQVGRTGGAIIREDSTATANPTLVTLDLKDTGTSVFGGSIGTTTLALGTDPDMTIARQNNIALVKSGTGTQTLSGTNYYTGNTTVSGGKLTITSTGVINDTSGVSVGAGEFNYNSSTALTKTVSFSGTGGTLSGTGSTITLPVNVTSGNTLAIGIDPNTVGVMNFAGNLTVGGTYLFDLNNTTNTADLGDVAGNLTLGGILDLVQLGAYAAGDKFTLFAYDGLLTGTFTGIADDTNFTDAGGIWTMNYNDTTAGLNGGVSASSNYVTITAIPEPNAAALLGCLGTLLLMRRRRRK